MMARKRLALHLGERRSFEATFVRFASPTDHMGNYRTHTLLMDVRDDNGEDVCDHCWARHPTAYNMLSLNLEEGDVIAFDAKVTAYRRGYYLDDTERDFSLAHFKNIRIVRKHDEWEKDK